jgi:hypothetical protein
VKSTITAVEFIVYDLTDSWNGPTIGESVACETLATTTRWRVIDNTTFGIRTTSSRTRIDTFAIDTSLL